MSTTPRRDHHADEVHHHDLGLAHDLSRLISRRRALGVISGGVGLAIAGCSDDGSTTTGATATTTTETTTASTSTSSSDTATVPEETAGPYPGDGSNGPNVLTQSGVVRRDITKSFGDASGTAEGVPATVELTLIDVANGGGPLAGAAVYLWHCTRDGAYSLYDQSVSDENYLRGVQESGKDGKLSFETIFPAAYSGRWPHMHFEVYESLDAATTASSKLRTSQLALPADACNEVFATAGYEASLQNLAGSSLDSDMVFGDGYASQLAKVSGGVADGYTVKLNVGV